MSILLVEHDDVLRDLIAALLARCGYAVVPAASAQAALGLAQSGAARPDLVLLDMFLPQVNGLMLLESLRGLPGMGAVPAIVLSTLGFPEIVQRAVAAGAKDFVLKPFDPQVLVEKVSGVMAHAAA